MTVTVNLISWTIVLGDVSVKKGSIIKEILNVNNAYLDVKAVQMEVAVLHVKYQILKE